jgi:hypothetical protein
MIEASGLLEATPGALRPQTDTVGEIAAFGDRQTGQLDKANVDKGGVRRMGAVCEAEQSKALKEAQRRTRKKVLGLF